MKFTTLLTPENIRQGMVFSSKKTLFEMLSRMVEEQTSADIFDSPQCFMGLFSREKLGCTALGNGIAMPRAKLPENTQPIFIFLQLAEALDYEAADKRKVDMVLAAFIPGKQCSQYIPILAELAEKLSDKTLCKQLRAAKSAEEIWQIFEFVDCCENNETTEE